MNLLVTERLSDLLLTPDRLSNENLLHEGVPEEKISFVGNIMIDTLEANREKAASLSLNEIIKKNSITPSQNPKVSRSKSPKILPSQYALMTLHRPSNVDSISVLEPMINFLAEELCKDMILIWPVHPRTKKQLLAFSLWESVNEHPRIVLLEPLGYHEMLRLNMDARIMLTDSGGLQEECCVLGTPCLTLRWNTERPVTLKEHGGTSVLVGNEVEKIRAEYHSALSDSCSPKRPERWDGHTADRCLQAIISHN